MADLSSNRSEVAPAFQCYAADLLADAAGMTHEEFGMYWRLALHAWRDRGLPTDRARIALFLGTTPAKLGRAWPVVGAPFVEQSGRLVLPWMERQRAEQAERRERRSQAGRRGNEARWGSQDESQPDRNASRIATDETLAVPSPATASASALTTASAEARAKFPRVAEALDTQPQLLERFVGEIAGAETSFLGKCEKALGGLGEPASHRLTPEQLARAVDHYVTNIATGEEKGVNASRFEAYLGRERLRAHAPPREARTPAGIGVAGRTAAATLDALEGL